jgi:type I restriction enzyme R subunit
MTSIDKKKLSETDIRTHFITPAIQKAGWLGLEHMRQEFGFTAGRVTVNGTVVERGDQKRADYILYYKPNMPLAVVEAKDNKHVSADGIAQGLDYAKSLDIPFVYSSNGDDFVEHDRTRTTPPIERRLGLGEFPSPDELWRRYSEINHLTEAQERIITQDYYDDGSGRTPRYYQVNAINRTIEAIAKGRKRLLLVMATGTGKTYTAFQIIWRLWKAKAKKRILFLADRNILLDQTRVNDFKPFGQAMVKIGDRTIDTAYEIYLSLYQAVTGTEEEKNIYREFSPDFFDLVVIDECHRGSAAEDSNWREILDYFSGATHIGLTATPKDAKDASNIDYFGDPIYTYTLKQGIDDGFLAPYKVIRIGLSSRIPGAGELDEQDALLPTREYSQQDYDKFVISDERVRLVAEKITEYLRATDPFQKTIVFCEDRRHAARMRQALINANADLYSANNRYIVQITSGSPDVGELDNFIQPDQRYPVIAVTSKLMSTGVDAQTCRLVVLDKNIRSMTEFKQIIGRGTRINEDFAKHYFTIMDFRDATRLFEDPAFDGPAIQVYEPGIGDSPIPPDEDPVGEPVHEKPDLTYPFASGKPSKHVFDNREVYVSSVEVVYYDEHGKRVVEPLADFTRRMVLKAFPSFDEFQARWQAAPKKQVVLNELEHQGVAFPELGVAFGAELDAFDLVASVAFGQAPLSRQQRADSVLSAGFLAAYDEPQRTILAALLDKYVADGLRDLEDIKALGVAPLSRFGKTMEIVQRFGDTTGGGYKQAVQALIAQLYPAQS